MGSQPESIEPLPATSSDFNPLKARLNIVSSSETIENTSRLNLTSQTDLNSGFSQLELNTPAPRPLPDKANEKRENPAKKAIKGIGSILFPFKKWKSGSVALNAKKDKNPIRKWDTFHIKDNDEEQIDDWKQKHMIRVKKNLDSQSSEFEIPQRPRHISTDLITDDQSTKFPKSQSSSAGKHLSSQSSAIGPRLLSTFALGDISYTSSMGDLGGSSGTITSSAHTFDTNSTPPEDIRGNLSSPSSLNKSVFQKLGRIAPDLFPDEKDGEFSGDYTALLNIARFRKKYALVKQLGAGGHSTVHLAKTKDNSGSMVVAKFIHSSNVWHWHKQGEIKVPLEIVMMKTFLSLRIPEIIKYHEHYEIGDRFVIIMEYLGQDWIDLYDYIENYGPIEESVAKLIFKSVATVVSKMHHLGYTHNDIKDENVMIHKQTLQIKIIDFGSAMPLSEKPTSIFYGTQKFSCPEALGGNEYVPTKQEVWALGTLLYVLLFKMDPFGDDEEIVELDIEKRISRLRRGVFKHKISSDAVDAMVYMLDKDPEQRPSIDEVLELPFFDL